MTELMVDERSSSSVGAKVPLSVILPVLNEETNIGDALRSVDWADQVIVVDSHSTDRTVQIARAAGAEVVQFDYPGYGPKKQNWALENLDFRNDWAFVLAGDERVSPALRAEIATAIERETADGYLVDVELWFMGRPLRCFRPNWILRLFKHRLCTIEDLGLDDLPGTGDMEIHEHFLVSGKVGLLRSPLLHNDDRGLTPWLERHNKYATWEAHLYRRFRSEPIGVGPVQFLRLDSPRRKRVLRRIWVRLPFRPAIRFFVWYVLRRGFLDGRAGFVFCVLMSYHEFIIGAKIRELERSRGA